jgi:hypothetical protein
MGRRNGWEGGQTNPRSAAKRRTHSPSTRAESPARNIRTLTAFVTPAATALLTPDALA